MLSFGVIGPASLLTVISDPLYFALARSNHYSGFLMPDGENGRGNDAKGFSLRGEWWQKELIQFLYCNDVPNKKFSCWSSSFYLEDNERVLHTNTMHDYEPMSQKSYVVFIRTEVHKCRTPRQSPHRPIQ